MLEDLKKEVLKTKVTIGVYLLITGSVISILLVISLTYYTQAMVISDHEETDVQETEEEPPKDLTVTTEDKVEEKDQSTEGTKKEAKEMKNSHDDPFSDIELKASSAMVWDINKDKEIFAKDADRVLPFASITKLMTAIVALEKVDPELPVLIEKDFLKQYGNSGLFPNEKWLLNDLSKISVLTSANDASYAIAASVGSILTNSTHEEGVDHFISEMNKKAKEIGMEKTYFHNATGLDMEEDAGAYGSARDMVKMVLYALSDHSDILYATRHKEREMTSLSDLHHNFQNTNPAVSEMNGILASKTGYTDLAGGNLVVVINADLNYPVIVAVMGSTFKGRFEDTKKLITATKDHLNRHDN